MGPEEDLGSKMMMEQLTARTWSHGLVRHLGVLLEEERETEKQDLEGIEQWC